MNQRHRRTITTLLLIIAAAALLVGCNGIGALRFSRRAEPVPGRSGTRTCCGCAGGHDTERDTRHGALAASGQQRVFALG